MPDTPFPMTLNKGVTLIGEPCGGALIAQRAALKALLARHNWPKMRQLANGKPILDKGHCSLSHGGGWVTAARSPFPIGVDVEASAERLHTARRRFVGPADQPILDHFGDNTETLCRLWTAKEAAFKVFGEGVDFLTGLQWDVFEGERARATATVQQQTLTVSWHHLAEPAAWLATAVANT